MPSHTPLVSVIIPTYNCAKTLPLCLSAVLDQDYPELEVIVVDDGSSDGSVDIVRGYPCALVEQPRNLGPAAARNAGVRASEGEVLFFLDADVALAPDAVATAVRLLAENPGYGAVSGIYGTRPLVDDGWVERYQVLYAHYWRKRHEGPVSVGYFSLGAFRRTVIDDVGLFNEDLRANDNEDTEYGLRIAARHEMVLTSAIRGYHDDDDRLLPLLRKQYLRSSRLIPLVVARRGRDMRQEAAHSMSGVASALVTVCGLPLLGVPALAVVPLAALAVFAVHDRALLRFVAREAGPRFLPTFLALHLVVNATIGAAAAAGSVRWLFDAKFRRLYA